MIIRVERRDFGNSLDFLIISRREGLSQFIVAPVEFNLVERNEECKETSATFNIPFEAGQSMMDGLWDAGIRPSEGSGSTGSLRATENHLEDMRTIVAKQLDVEFKR